GDAADAVFTAQQWMRLGVEHLPREHAGLAHDLAAVTRIRVAVEVQALVDIALALGVDEEPERIIMLLALVADGAVTVGRAIDVRGDGMAGGKMAVGRGADRQRHGEARAHVEAGAADLGELPARTQIARAHFRIRLEAPARKHDGTRPDFDLLAEMLGDYTG